MNNSQELESMDSQNFGEYKECANCGETDTPLWRKFNDHDLCNACGIYYRVNGFHRPFLPNMRKLLSSARKMDLNCVNCGTKTTSMWRRNTEGENICNACGLYFRLNGIKRPISLRKDWIRKRKRRVQQISGIIRLANQNCLQSSECNQIQINNNYNVNNDEYMPHIESQLTTTIINEQKNCSHFQNYFGHCYQKHQNECSEYNPNVQLNEDFNSEFSPVNDIKVFPVPDGHNS